MLKVQRARLQNLQARCSMLMRYASRQGLKWSVSALREDTQMVRLIDTTDEQHDVVLAFDEAVEMFEEMTDVAALGCY